LLEDPAALWKQQQPDRAEAFADALNAVFTLQSGAGNAADLLLCQKRTMDLMRRQHIPVRIDALRTLSDTDLYRLGILAAIGGLGQWKRHESTDALLIDEQGVLIRALVPDTVESDVLLCLICALLTIIAVYHVTLAGVNASGGGQPAPPAATVTRAPTSAPPSSSCTVDTHSAVDAASRLAADSSAHPNTTPL
jgi:hypothetical protein